MCGICGIIDFDPRRVVEKTIVDHMLRHLVHRGPDDQGVFADNNVAFGHRRLSIIDLEGGRQPIFNEDGSVCVIVNGEIYNYKELKGVLREDHVFATRSDSEIIAHLWEEYGVACVSYLRGMFAFALYDRKREVVFLARDRFGQKPLVYARTDKGLIFCSEIFPLTQIPCVDNTLSLQGLDDFFSFHYIPAPKTIFNGIRKLEPAHTLLIRRDGVVHRRYWRLNPFARCRDSYETAKDRVGALIQESVGYRMIADVPVGAFLSGGVDSSIIVGMMRKNNPGGVIETVTIGFDEAVYDERRYAESAADKFKTRHHLHVARPDVLEILPRLVRHYGEPYGDPSAIPTWYLSQVTAQHVKVALSGDGGDELFAGYNRLDSTRLAEVYQKLPRALRRNLLEPLVQALPETRWREAYVSQLKQFMKGAGKPLLQRFSMRNSVFSPDIKENLISAVVKTALDGYCPTDHFARRFESLKTFSETEKLYWMDLSVFLPDDILTKVDIASMAHGLEVRSPFLDHVLAEYVCSLPFPYKHKLFRRKRILKDVGGEFFDPAFLNRKKMGFRIPIGKWFRTSLRNALWNNLMESPIFADSRLFQIATVQRIFEEHRSGKFNHTERLWNLWFLGEWSKQGNVNWTA
jgi:asparagine synthase (glutamine-hydrolysing)